MASLRKIVGAGPLGPNLRLGLIGPLWAQLKNFLLHFVWKIERFKMICNTMGFRTFRVVIGDLGPFGAQ